MLKLLSVHYIYLIPLLGAMLVSLRSFIYSWPRAFRQFSYFLILTFFIEIFAILWKWFLHKTPYWNYQPWNYWIYDAFTILKLLFLMYFYSKILHSVKVKRILLKGLIPVTLLGITEYVTINNTYEPNIYTIVFGNLIIVILCLIYFRELLNNITIKNLRNNPALLISIGLLLYHSATTPFFIYMNLLNSKSPRLFVDFASINHVFNIIMYTLFLTSFLCKPSFHK